MADAAFGTGGTGGTGHTGRAPLSGITVVSFEQAVSLPYCTRLLADLGGPGHHRVEQPPRGDFTRDYDDVVQGMAAHFVWLNRNKESLLLDLKAPGAAEVLERLLAESDVCLQNLAPGAAARLGIAAEQVVARHPRLMREWMSRATAPAAPTTTSGPTTCWRCRPRRGCAPSPARKATRPRPDRRWPTWAPGCTPSPPCWPAWWSGRPPGRGWRRRSSPCST